MIFARRPFKRLVSPSRYNATRLDQQFINVEQAMPSSRIRTVTADTTATVDDRCIAVDATDGAVTITLPAPDRVVGLELTVAKIDNAAHAITISGTVSGVVDPTLDAQYDSLTVLSIGDAYLTVASAAGA